MSETRLEPLRCQIAVVVPAFNEAESLPELIDRIDTTITGMNRTWEVWVIDDGSDDGTFDVVAELAQSRPQVHGISFGRNFGKAPESRICW